MTADLALPPPAADGDEPPDPLYASVPDWVTAHFLPVYRRPIGGEFRWCPQWWRHAEAITRLTALWQSWEAMRLQPGTGTANWLRDHLDHQLPVLLGRSGPFAQCSRRPSTSSPAPPPPSRRPPAGGTPDGDRSIDEDADDYPAPDSCPRPRPAARPGPWSRRTATARRPPEDGHGQHLTATAIRHPAPAASRPATAPREPTEKKAGQIMTTPGSQAGTRPAPSTPAEARCAPQPTSSSPAACAAE